MSDDAPRQPVRPAGSDDDLQAVLVDVLVRLVRIEEMLVTVCRRTSVLLDDVWWLRDQRQRQGYAGVERRRACGR